MENNLKEDVESGKGNIARKLFSFSGRSSSANYLIYGIILPPVISIVGGVVLHLLFKTPELIGVIVFVGFIMAMAAMVRRGHDIGMTSVTTLVLYLGSAILISVSLSYFFKYELIVMFGSYTLAKLAIFLLSNVFIIYLLFAPTSNREIPKSSKVTKIIVGIIVVGILAAVAIPKFMNNKANTNTKACDAGDAASCNLLGMKYLSGLDGFKPDAMKSLEFYKKACSYGSMDGCHRTGAAYNMGAGVPRDYVMALSFYKKGCDGGDVGACVSAGISYEFGEGTTKNISMAKQYYKKACDGGNKKACKMLDKYNDN